MGWFGDCDRCHNGNEEEFTDCSTCLHRKTVCQECNFCQNCEAYED